MKKLFIFVLIVSVCLNTWLIWNNLSIKEKITIQNGKQIINQYWDAKRYTNFTLEAVNLLLGDEIDKEEYNYMVGRLYHYHDVLPSLILQATNEYNSNYSVYFLGVNNKLAEIAHKNKQLKEGDIQFLKNVKNDFQKINSILMKYQVETNSDENAILFTQKGEWKEIIKEVALRVDRSPLN